MASIRKTKREIDYLVSELISNCYTCLCFHSDKKRGPIFDIVEEAVELRNRLFEQVNNPQEKHNSRLLRKQFIQIRQEMFEGVDGLFQKLSETCK